MTEKQEKKQAKEESAFEWRELVMTYATTVIREFSDGFVGRIRSSFEMAIANIVRKSVVVGISFLGVVLLVLGSVHLLNSFTGTSYAGYFILGGLLVLLGFLVSLISGKLGK
ncbi:MAG: hypothetical protein IPN70_01625 [Candidatus Moraniibacteriota bacterium]|nr:MAG: hypothetical protein IPN70_01625 [Candidatus Moranbacteria bacterium]